MSRMRVFTAILFVLLLPTICIAAGTDRSGRKKKRRTKGITSKAPGLPLSLTNRKQSTPGGAKARLKLGDQRTAAKGEDDYVVSFSLKTKLLNPHCCLLTPPPITGGPPLRDDNIFIRPIILPPQ